LNAIKLNPGFLLSVTLIFLSLSCVFNSGNASSFSSVEFGHGTGAGGSNHALSSTMPTGGLLFTAWTRLPSDWNNWGHNMDVLIINAGNWHMRCLVGNVGKAGDGTAVYNANTMLFTNDDGQNTGTSLWAGDYSIYYSDNNDRISVSQATGWVWVAWQVVMDNSGFTIRQWLKFGIDGPVIQAWDINTSQTGSEHVTFAQLREFLLDPANNGWHHDNGLLLTAAQLADWVPGQPLTFQVGSDNSNLTHIKVYSRSDWPDLSELNAIATEAGSDTNAWADYVMEWTGGAADLGDRSGHGRDLALQSGGRLYKGQGGLIFP